MHQPQSDVAENGSTARLWASASATIAAAALVCFLFDWQTPAKVSFLAAIVILSVAAGRSIVFSRLTFAMWVLVFATSALLFPAAWISWAGEQPEKFIGSRVIAPLVQVIMLGMGMTLTFADFARVVRMPLPIVIGFVLQFTVMPVMGLVFAWLFRLPPEVAVGLILYGSCSDGMSSNVLAYLAKANVPLSVTLTTCTTLAAPIVTPLCMKLLADQYVPIEFWPMMTTILNMILAPVLIGLLVNRYLHRYVKPIMPWMPFVAMLAICIAVALTVALSRQDLLVTGLFVFGAAVCHNASGFVLGYWGSRLCGLNETDSRTISIDVGMQNGGMATGLAFNVLQSKAAAMVSAVEGPWGAIAGCGLASYWANADRKSEKIVDSSVGLTSSNSTDRSSLPAEVPTHSAV